VTETARAYATTSRLADGREIIYFDRQPRSHPPPPDPRHLRAVHAGSQLRYDAARDEWVTVASHRQDRTHRPGPERCPLCPSAPGRPTEVPAAGYEVVVLENRFPSFAGDDNEPARGRPEPWTARSGNGRCEVVCFSDHHDAAFADLTPEHARTVVEAWAHRTRALAAMDGVAYVYVFENRGPEIGVTLTHPHGQIYGYPFVPPVASRRRAAAARHRRSTGRCLGCDLVAGEADAGQRVVSANSRWVAHVPFAARWPFHVVVSPLRHVETLPALDDGERQQFCHLYLDVLGRLDRVFGVPMPYMAGWHQGAGEHLCMEVFSTRRAPDKLKYLAASESGQGAWINDVAPEASADLLRRAAGPTRGSL
jgi:UDPglucose--hexose-1-phosphate uridylyltransferase